MARSWERMVQRNTKQVNKKRQREGKGTISSLGAASKAEIYRGRNIVMPVILVALGILYWLVGMMQPEDQKGSIMNWIGIVLYLQLAALIFFRRPFLKIDRSRLSTFKFNRERILTPGDIEKIIISKGSVSIKQKGKRSHWIFSRLINRYDIPSMAHGLEQYAKANHVTVEYE